MFGESSDLILLCIYCKIFHDVYYNFKMFLVSSSRDVYIISRRWYQVRAEFLFGVEGAERVGLPPGDRFRTVRAGQTGRTSTVPVGGQVRSSERRGAEGDRATVLQAAVPERARLRGGQRRRHHGASAVMRPAPCARYRQVRRERRWPPGAGRELSQPKEAQPPQLRPGHRPWHTADRVLLPRAAAAQHTRLSDIRGRIQGREEVLQAVHHRAH